jgi:hypothetical protein
MSGASLWVVLLACGVLGGWLALLVQRWLEASRARTRQVRAVRGERDAERMLRAEGYRIEARQLRTSYTIEVDGEPHEVDLVLDFVVERRGERLVVEVKTGRHAPRLSCPETRRQLLEYQLATGCRRVLLLDPTLGAITEVAFPLPASESRASARGLPLLALLLVCAVLVLVRALR